jgi:MoaA/NifB/PqqE/SkfB family radical SAM enzyme
MHTKLNEIKQVELELSSYCNASCPLCSRNFYGHNYKDPSFGLKHLGLTEIKKIFDTDTISNLEKIILQGNFGDFAMNPETPEIVDYFLSVNPNLVIEGHTNGSVQKTTWWSRLNRIKIFFALDGIDQETHQLYRKDTNFDKIIENARAVQAAGGTVVWKMIVFDHNQHQVGQCKEKANELGFEFCSIKNVKSSGPVFNQQKIYLHDVGNWKGFKKVDGAINGQLILDDLDSKESTVEKMNCTHVNDRIIYISADGDVFPCCYMGHAVGKWNNGRWIQLYNDQLKPLVSNHNSITASLADSIKWFKKIPDTWKIKKFSEGRLLYCDSNCSK